MVAAESAFEVPQTDEIYLVSQRKYNLDPSRPWWQKAYFRYIFLTFVRLSFRYAGIAAAGAIESDGTVVIIEQQKVCTTKADAEALCRSQNEFWSWKPLPVDTELPTQSVQYKGHHNPLSVIPDRYRRRTFPVTVAPEHQMREVKRNLEQTIKSLAAT